MNKWIVSVISVAAIVISIIALAKVAPTQGIDFDYIGAIIGVLSFLVTLLIGYQIYTVINVKEELKELQRVRGDIELTVEKKVKEAKEQIKNDISNLLPILIAIDSEEISDMISTAMRVHQEADGGSIAESFSDGVIMSFIDKGIPEDEEERENHLKEFARKLDSNSVASYYSYFLKKEAKERQAHRDIEIILVKLISILADNKREGVA